MSGYQYGASRGLATSALRDELARVRAERDELREALKKVARRQPRPRMKPAPWQPAQGPVDYSPEACTHRLAAAVAESMWHDAKHRPSLSRQTAHIGKKDTAYKNNKYEMEAA